MLFVTCYLVLFYVVDVGVTAVSEFVDEGNDFVAYCNIPDISILDIIQNLTVQWFHNGEALTNLCELLRPELVKKYSCKILASQASNISLEMRISGV